MVNDEGIYFLHHIFFHLLLYYFPLDLFNDISGLVKRCYKFTIILLNHKRESTTRTHKHTHLRAGGVVFLGIWYGVISCAVRL